MRHWLAGLAAAILAASPAGAAPGDLLYARPGRLVAASDGAKLNFYCMGKGAPAVVLDAGFTDWSPAWATVQPAMAKFTRVCSYDRAGTGFSTRGPLPRTSVRIAGELRSALRNAGIRGPYVLVGHAFGGDNIRAFADLYPGDVAGLVMMEADPSDVEPRAMQEEDHRGNRGGIAFMRACRAILAAGKTPPPLSPGSDRTCADGFFRGLPEPVWSAALNAKLREIGRKRVDMYDTNISEMAQMPADEAFLQRHRRFLGRTPVRVITTLNHGIHHLDRAPPQTAADRLYQQKVARAQARWLSLSSDSRQVFARNASEYVQFDAPGTVVATVREVWERSRRR